MKILRGCAIICLSIGLFAGWIGAYLCDKEAVTSLKATVRSGQVFLTWNEKPVLEGVTFNVFPKVQLDPGKIVSLEVRRSF